MKILVIGDAMIDHYQYGIVTRKSPEDPSVDVLDAISDDYRLGGCLNVAANLKSLSGHSIDVSSILSEISSNMLIDRSIDRSSSYRLWKDRGIVKTRIINTVTGKQIVRVDNKKKFGDFILEEYHYLFDCIRFDKYDAIVVSDYDKGIVNDDVIKRLEKFDGPVFIDTKKPDLSIWSGIKKKFIKINAHELGIAESWKEVKDLIVTNGKHGCQWWKKPGWLLFPTQTTEDPDVIGCGDVFLAAFSVEYLKSGSITFALNFANKMATKSTLTKGTVAVTNE